ncbi:hypothetical protein [Streptomyces sp. NBC_01185]|uniref:hypothetical protein n=1 Tax=Streptomyces sp. NBC_01185 TaxID=2903764 RepID=UPI00386D3ED2|nr:hypothetical protein OG770_18265 [Streptomyces sp. NBC_01185]
MTPEPIAAVDLFRTVLAAAGERCQCTGACGHAHTQSGGRCPRQHGQQAPLMAAPPDPTTPERIAVSLPTAKLRAWCPGCHSAACRTAKRPPAEAVQDGLFDL